MLTEKEKAKIIAVTFQKGGVGKTAISLNLAVMLAYRGKKVLFIDGDRHNSGSQNVGIMDPTKVGFYDVIVGNCSLDDAIQEINFKPDDDFARKFKPFSIYGIPSYDNIGGKETEISHIENWEFLFDEALKRSEAINNFDFIIIDCPPESDIFLPVIYTATEYYIFPLVGAAALTNLGTSCEQIVSLSSGTKRKTIIGGVFNMCDQYELTFDLIDSIRSMNIINCFETEIPRYRNFTEAELSSLPVFMYYHCYKLGWNIYHAFLRLTDEVIKKFEEMEV